MSDAIVYLAQNSPRDPQYGRDARSMLERSLDLLYANYNEQFNHRVLIFHEGDFGLDDQEVVAAGRPEIEFHEVRFEVPPFLPEDEVPEVWEGFHPFGLGHRHMCRFYSLDLFDILADLGVEWYFRMDDDSFIHSRIDYDLFEFMRRSGYEYGYRVDVQDGLDVTRGFGETVFAYLVAEDIEPTFFFDHLVSYSWLSYQRDGWVNRAKNAVKTVLLRQNPERRLLRWNWPSAPPRLRRFVYDRKGYYNNFHITRVGFWKSPEVQRFLRHFDRIGAAYKYRWNDLVLQSAAVQVFCPRRKLYKFTDWTYEHATIRDERLFFGGIYEGSADRGSKTVQQFVSSYGRTNTPQTW